MRLLWSLPSLVENSIKGWPRAYDFIMASRKSPIASTAPMAAAAMMAMLWTTTFSMDSTGMTFDLPMKPPRMTQTTPKARPPPSSPPPIFLLFPLPK